MGPVTQQTFPRCHLAQEAHLLCISTQPPLGGTVTSPCYQPGPASAAVSRKQPTQWRTWHIRETPSGTQEMHTAQSRGSLCNPFPVRVAIKYKVFLFLGDVYEEIGYTIIHFHAERKKDKGKSNLFISGPYSQSSFTENQSPRPQYAGQGRQKTPSEQEEGPSRGTKTLKGNPNRTRVYNYRQH